MSSNHKRVASQHNYVKVQNSEISSQGTAENTAAAIQLSSQGGAPTNLASNHRGITHTLGNTLGNQK